MALNPLTLQVIPGELDGGFCPPDFQSMLNGFSAKQTVTFPDTFKGVTVSQSKPTDINQAWLQLDTLGRPVRFYYFSQGSWLSLHPQVPGATMLWTTALPNFSTFDGGDSNPPGLYSGPMWEAVSALAAKMPIGVGTLPSSKVLAVGDTGGEENHTIVIGELPKHRHGLTHLGRAVADGEVAAAGGNLISQNPPADDVTYPSPVQTDEAGNGDAMNNLPPYVAVYFLRRSARLYYSVS